MTAYVGGGWEEGLNSSFKPRAWVSHQIISPFARDTLGISYRPNVQKLRLIFHVLFTSVLAGRPHLASWALRFAASPSPQASQTHGHSQLEDTSRSWLCQTSLSLKASQNNPIGLLSIQLKNYLFFKSQLSKDLGAASGSQEVWII